MVKLAPFNKLPPRPEYINSITKVLTETPNLRPIDIEKITKLTRTQVLCTLDLLLKEGKVETTGQSPRTYSINTSYSN